VRLQEAAMNVAPFAILWAVLAISVVMLALFRKVVAQQEDDILHLSEGSGRLVESQSQVARKLDAIDHWGKILTVIGVVYGLVLIGVYTYQFWQENTTYLVR
jgi:hypothetical protein